MGEWQQHSSVLRQAEDPQDAAAVFQSAVRPPAPGLAAAAVRRRFAAAHAAMSRPRERQPPR